MERWYFVIQRAFEKENYEREWKTKIILNIKIIRIKNLGLLLKGLNNLEINFQIYYDSFIWIKIYEKKFYEF